MTATVIGISVDGRQGRVSNDATREYTVIYKVRTDDRADGPVTVTNAFGIPNIGDIFQPGNDLDAAAVVTNKTSSQGDSPYFWLVEVTYSTAIADPTVFTNPLDAPAEISYGFQQRQILVPGYFNDPTAPPTNQAWEQGVFAPNGELFDPQPEAPLDEPVLTIKKNMAADDWNSAAQMALANCVNLTPWQNADARQLKLSAPQAERRYHNNVGYYWEVSRSIAFRWETWDIQLLNQGTFYWSSGKPTNPWSTTTTRLTKKDENGNVLMVNLTTNGAINTTSTPTFTRIRFFREVEFATLGLL